MKRVIPLIFVIIFFIPHFSHGQRWKKTRYELMFGLGTSNFMGDLGGGVEDAAHFFGVRDVDLAATRPVIHLGFRYKLLEVLAVKTNLIWSRVYASDEHAGHLGRKARNLHFRSNIWEASLQFELSIIKEPIGSRYQQQRYKGLQKYGVNVYLFAGIGGFKFNPKAQYFKDQLWYELQPLSTEGQGIVDTVSANPPEAPYSLFALAIPIGIGFKYHLDANWAIGVELGNRYTSTDYLDDASGSYYDEANSRFYYPGAAIQQHVTETQGEYMGEVARFFADPTIDLETGNYVEGGSYRRGDSNYNDAYVFLIINVVYRLKTSRSGLPKF